MCGISGKLHFDPTYRVQEQELHGMAESIVHRGPDDSGYYIAGNVGLGFRRLSIIDLSTGHQPLCNEDGKIWIVFNGEVYNYQALRQQLRERGHQFRTQTDTEVIVHAYEEYGNRCVEHLRGMFAFAIWDDRKKKLFIARDRFGIKPLFYHLSQDRFVFGSEIKAVLAAGGITKEIDSQALDSYFAYKYITDDRTIFREIKKLRPAHTLEIAFEGKQPKITFRKYWDIHYEPDYSKTEREWCEELESVLSEAVKMRLVSDVPLGAFLSGGIDSSSVVALMCKHSNAPVKTFSIGFREQAFNELPYARAVAEHYQTEHHEQIIEPESISLLPKLVWAYDEPYADPSAIPTYYVSKFAREYVTVALSGDGGDELFAGYDTYPKLQHIYKYHRLPHTFNKHFWGSVHQALPNSLWGKGLSYHLSKKREEVGAFTTQQWTLPERQKLYRPELWDTICVTPAEAYKQGLIAASSSDDYLFRMLELDMRTYMVDDVLTKVDRASMLNSLEVRVPILDHKVAELSFRIPSAYKLRGQQKKYILKKTMEPYLPASILAHPKQGFGVPLKMWFKDSLWEYVNDRLHSNNNRLTEYVNMGYVRKVLQDHDKGMRDMNFKIWSLLVLDAWLEQFEGSTR